MHILLSLHHAGQIVLKLFYQLIIAGLAVFLGKLIGILPHDIAAYTVMLRFTLFLL